MKTKQIEGLTEINDAELETVQGGNAILTFSSNLGHLGRAFGAGYAVGLAINWFASQGGDSSEYYAP